MPYPDLKQPFEVVDILNVFMWQTIYLMFVGDSLNDVSILSMI